MSMKIPDEKSYAYVISHFNDRHERVATVHPQSLGTTITISHQTGSDTHEIAERLAQILQELDDKGTCPWAVYHQQLHRTGIGEKPLAKGTGRENHGRQTPFH